MLKDIIMDDINNVFFNCEELAEEHIINKKPLNIIIDDEALKRRTKKEYEGIYVGDILYFVKAEDYGKPPRIEDIQIFDGKTYKVFDVSIEYGVYEIILQSNMS